MMKNIELESENVQKNINETIETIFNEKRFYHDLQVRMDSECEWMLKIRFEVEPDDDGNEIYFPYVSMVNLPTNTTVWSLDDSYAFCMVCPDGGTYEEAIERMKEIVFDFCDGCERAVKCWNTTLNDNCEWLLYSGLADDKEYVDEFLNDFVEDYVENNDVIPSICVAIFEADANNEYYYRKTAAAFEKMCI